ncbi:hypothetical protein WOLCODRAFT_159398 [Wolfiporia cocos MD-104 SS10]|uniref:DUF6533 domain-containing protein n=1 Tax=Wolfiporia cocos (strain MD-104) TaxID=742152 RepID=A0A2H3K1K1_WOLCO|nr:hypothetical protein WOLCODRAFT_159398 [Wolfiporia cocos MD-104 SS10]
MSLSFANATETSDIDTVRTALTGDYFAISSSAVIFYECIITLDREISYVWKYRRTAATVLLLSNRCFLIIYALVQFPLEPLDDVGFSFRSLTADRKS